MIRSRKVPAKVPFYSFMTSLKTFVDEARARGVYPVLVTPTQRRSFDENGKIKDTHLDFPDAVRWLAEKENIPLIDLHAMTRILYEAWEWRNPSMLSYTILPIPIRGKTNLWRIILILIRMVLIR